jgi:hypothetical protein
MLAAPEVCPYTPTLSSSLVNPSGLAHNNVKISLWRSRSCNRLPDGSASARSRPRRCRPSTEAPPVRAVVAATDRTRYASS